MANNAAVLTARGEMDYQAERPAKRARLPGTETEEVIENPKSGTSKRRNTPRSAPTASPLGMITTLVDKAWPLGLAKVLKASAAGPRFRVATMCSGTESPILALGLIKDALLALDIKLSWEHCFSAEIVPFKQSFIQRNFQPPVLFRDVTELCAGAGLVFSAHTISVCLQNPSSTVYGGRATLPDEGQVDVLVAGFACVDFSNLNRKKKKLAPDDRQAGSEEAECEGGESAATFFAILGYARKYRPAILLIENVISAPWKIICDYFRDIGYSVNYGRMDTKHFLLPQTRVRGYLMGVNHVFTGPFHGLRADDAVLAVEEWGQLMKSLSVAPRCSVEDFLIDPDHPKLKKAMATISQEDESETKNVVEWAVCEGRHKRHRKDQLLGHRTPYTAWKRGEVVPPEYAYRAWLKKQTERVKDCLDMLYLENAAKGDDFEHKLHTPDLSQNIDRRLEQSLPGVIGCITPSGIPYISTRGGPIVGLEVLALQGLPVDRIVLTSETNRQIKDLAGNAMSTTVIAAALLAALIVAGKALPQRALPDWKDSWRARQHPPRNSDRSMMATNLYFEKTTGTSVAKVLELAHRSGIKCDCEDRPGLITIDLLKCRACFALVCSECCGHPTHVRPLISSGLSHAEQRDFRQTISSALPTRLSLDLSVATIKSVMTPEASLNSTSYNAFYSTLGNALGEELVFKDVKRAGYWTVTYESPCQVLRLVFRPNDIQWLLFVKASEDSPEGSEVRSLLDNPVARCTLDPHWPNDFLAGPWEIRTPRISRIPAVAIGQGDLVPSWGCRIGLSSNHFREERVWSRIEIKLLEQSDDSRVVSLAGSYTLLPDCGTANGSLHRKDNRRHDSNQQTYLFLDPALVGDPGADSFVIARDHSRLGSREYRGELARIVARGQLDKPDQLAAATYAQSSDDPKVDVPSYTQWRPNSLKSQFIEIVIDGDWRPCEARLREPEDSLRSLIPASGPSKVLYRGGMEEHCTRGLRTLFCCQLSQNELNLGGCQNRSSCLITEHNQMAVSLRVDRLNRFVDRVVEELKEWIMMDKFVEDQCNSCAPRRPDVKWRLRLQKRQIDKPESILVPQEDATQASEYEIRMKTRPVPFLIQLYPSEHSSGSLELRTAINPQALVHRASARLLSNKMESHQGSIQTAWRLLPDSLSSSNPSIPALTIPSNRNDRRRFFRFPGTERKLRPDQQRSLHWMKTRDCRMPTGFIELAVEETEATHLCWRLEARAQRTCIVRGGIVADDIGYGKTVITLALVVDTLEEARNDLSIPTPLIPARATLTIVPATLLSQWEDEIGAFWPLCRLVKIQTLRDLELLSVQNVVEADLVLVSVSILNHTKTPKYTRRLASLAGLPLPSALSAVQEFRTWSGMSATRISEKTQRLKETRSLKEHSDILQVSIRKFHEDSELFVEPSKRLRGKKFADRKKEVAFAEHPKRDLTVHRKFEGDERKVLEGLEDDDVVPQIKFPVLHMFRWHRKVIDEQSYLDGHETSSVTNVQSLSTWILSGTPKIRDVTDVQNLGSLLGVYLGALDITEQYTCKENVKEATKMRTTVEEFEDLGAAHSAAWHCGRHAQAQNFLNVFARKNRADIAEISTQTRVEPIVMSTLHETLYLELQAHILSGNARHQALTNDRLAAHDRQQRLAIALSKRTPFNEILLRAAFSLPLSSAPGSESLPVVHPGGSLQEVVHLREEDVKRKATLLLKCLATVNSFRRKRSYDHIKEQRRPSESWKSAADRVTLVHERCRGVFEAVTDEGFGDLASGCFLGMLKEKTCVQKDQTENLQNPLGTNVSAADLEEGNESTSGDCGQARAGGQKGKRKRPRGPLEKARKSVDDLTKLERALVDSMRAWRWIQVMETFEGQNISGVQERQSLRVGSFCQHDLTDATTIAVNQQCGHLSCGECAGLQIDDGRCSGMCDAATLPTNFIIGSDVRTPMYQRILRPVSKVARIAEAIRKMSESAQVLVFCQYEDLAEEVRCALAASGISCRHVKDPDKSVADMQDFRTAKYGSMNWFKVLILNPLDSSAAGHNLTNVHVVLFVTPIITDSAHEADSSYMQAIGRAKRFGQEAEVTVLHFLVLNTLEVNIFEERQGQKIVSLMPEAQMQSLGERVGFASRLYAQRTWR